MHWCQPQRPFSQTDKLPHQLIIWHQAGAVPALHSDTFLAGTPIYQSSYDPPAGWS
jgi:hypothetical protein